MRQPSVLDLLRERRAADSRPGRRTDPFRVALVIEGGGNRAAYSAGMAIALVQAGLLDTVDAVYGTSGGALNAAWLLTGEAERWLPSWAWPEVAQARVTDPRRLVRGGPLVDLERLTDHVYEQITPMDFDAILSSPIELHPIATDADTGEAADLADLVHDRATLKSALRASACLPLLAGAPVELGGRRWLDGGLAEPIPLPTALDQGASHVLLFRTRRTNQPARDSRLERLVLAPYFRRTAPAAGRTHARRASAHDTVDRLLGERPAGVQILEVRPPDDAHDVSRLSSDLAAIETAIAIGLAQGSAALA